MHLTGEPPMVPEDFSEAEDDVLCFNCDDNLVDPTRDTDVCVECATRHGELCSKDGCMAVTSILTEDGHKCERHAVKYLQELVQHTFQLMQKVREEENSLHDKLIQLEELKESPRNRSGEVQQKKHVFQQMKANVNQRRSTLFDLRSEISNLQEELGVEYVEFSTHQQHDRQ